MFIGHRLRDFDVRVGYDLDLNAPEFDSFILCFHQHLPLNPGETRYLTCQSTVRGTILVVRNLIPRVALVLCEVQVFGSRGQS